MNKLLFFITSILLLAGCQSPTSSVKKMPILGERDVVDGDTVYHTIPDFLFVNQDGKAVTPKTFEGKAYITDYFFTSCPTICPKVKQQEMRVAEHFKNESDLKFLSISFDTKYDTIPRLKWYADKLELDANQWHLVTGEKDLVYGIANDFFHVAKEDPTAEGGFDHDGNLILVDKNKNIRAFVNALEPEKIDQFIKEVESVLNEN